MLNRSNDKPDISLRLASGDVSQLIRRLSICLVVLLTISTTALGAAWTPADTNTVAWYDASDTSTLTTNATGDVSQMDDKSGNSNHIAQGTASLQPTTGTRTLNDLNVLDFDGGDTMIATPPVSAIDFTFIAVGQSDVDANGAFFMMCDKDSQLIFEGGVRYFASSQFGIFTRNTQYYEAYASGYPNGSPHIAGGYFESSTSRKLYVDGTLATTLTSSSTFSSAIDRFSIGAYTDSSPGSYLNGLIAEVVCFTGGATDTRQKIEGYLAWKWGLQDNLPGDHPYKSAAPTVSSAQGTIILFE